MSEPGGQFVEPSARRRRRSHCYSPLNRAPGLRRVPDEPTGLAFLSSLILHAVLILSLVRVMDTTQERPGADVSAIFADLVAGAPGIAPTRIPAPRSAPRGERPVADRSAATKTTMTLATASSRPTLGALAPTVTRPAAASPPRIAMAEVPAGSTPPSPVSPVGPAQDGPTLVPAPVASSMFDIDTPLDAGWPEPPRPAVASPNPTQPAKTLTSVPLLRDSAPAAAEAVPPILGPEPVRTAAELRERPLPATAPDGLGVDALEWTAPGLSGPEPFARAVVAETSRAISSAPLSADPTPAPTALATPSATSPPAVAQTSVAPVPEKPLARPVIAQSEPRPGSLLGLRLDRAFVRLDEPRTWVTDQPIRTVSGTVLGGVPERLVLYVNGIPTDVNPGQRTFETAVLLRPGANELRAVVTGPSGLEAEDTITVQYVPRPSENGIVLTSPSDGLTLGPDDPPVAVVEGEVDDKAVATVWIVANDRRIPVATSRGRFRHVLLLPDPLVNLWAETSSGDAAHRSGAVTIRMAGARPPSVVLVMQWPAGTEESSVDVSATWRAHPERLDTLVQTLRLPVVGKGGDGAPSDVFYLRGLKPGVYTLIVRYRGAAPLGDARPTLYLPDKTPRTLGPVSLNGAGRRVLTKILMPHAVLWNQDDWFSGRSESVDAVTKFRIPEGITWVERKADLP